MSIQRVLIILYFYTVLISGVESKVPLVTNPALNHRNSTVITRIVILITFRMAFR